MQSAHTVILQSPADVPSDCRLNCKARSQTLHTQGAELCFASMFTKFSQFSETHHNRFLITW